MKAIGFYCKALCLFFLFITVYATDVCSQTNANHVSTKISADARFEIIQSTIAARWTFKVDKYTGDVFQIVQETEGGLTWEKMLKIPHIQNDTRYSNKVNYQLFMSGTLARITFLMNINTGVTWQLTQSSESDLVYWSPIR